MVLQGGVLKKDYSLRLFFKIQLEMGFDQRKRPLRKEPFENNLSINYGKERYLPRRLFHAFIMVFTGFAVKAHDKHDLTVIPAGQARQARFV